MRKPLVTYLAISGVVCLVALSDLRPVVAANGVVAASMRAETAMASDDLPVTASAFPDAQAAVAAASMSGAKPYFEP